MANVQIEIKFAQSLAGNEKKYRDKALKKLRKFLKAKSSYKKDGFTTEDFLKLWKGLHYCMWMQDKAIVQEELSSHLSKLVHELSCVEAQMLFIRVFYLTEAREWNSIDIWRLDKFMMLVRNMLTEALIVLKKHKWNPSLITSMNTIHRDTVMHPNLDNIPDGLKIHMADIYLDELEKIGHKQLDGPKILHLLDPFINYIKKAPKAALVKRIVKKVFQPIIDRALQVYMRNNDKTEEAEEEEDIPYLSLKIDSELIADHLFKVAQEPDVLERNRPVLYSIVTELRDAVNGVDKSDKDIEPEDISSQEISHAVNSLVSLESRFMRKSKKKKKKDKKKGKEGKENLADGNNNNNPAVYEATDIAPSTSQQVSKQQLMSSSVHTDVDENTDSPSPAKKSKKSEKKLKKKNKKTEAGSDAINIKIGGKRSHSQTETSEAPQGKVPKIIIEGTGAKTPDSEQPAVRTPVVNKTPKGTPSSSQRPVFAKFDNAKPPPAFLKKSIAKATGQKRPAPPTPHALVPTTPLGNKTPGSTMSKTPGSTKRVSFDMKKNTAQGFKESMKRPPTPYNPGKEPDQGILKTPIEGATPTSSAPSSSTSVQKRVTRQSISTPKSCGPLLTMGSARSAAAKRMRATDFFL